MELANMFEILNIPLRAARITDIIQLSLLQGSRGLNTNRLRAHGVATRICLGRYPAHGRGRRGKRDGGANCTHVAERKKGARCGGAGEKGRRQAEIGMQHQHGRRLESRTVMASTLRISLRTALSQRDPQHGRHAQADRKLAGSGAAHAAPLQAQRNGREAAVRAEIAYKWGARHLGVVEVVQV